MTSSEDPHEHGTGRMLLLIAALVLVVAGLKAAQNFFLPVLLAFFVATVSYPITARLGRRRTPRTPAVLDGSDEFRWIGVAISADVPRSGHETQPLRVATAPANARPGQPGG